MNISTEDIGKLIVDASIKLMYDEAEQAIIEELRKSTPITMKNKDN